MFSKIKLIFFNIANFDNLIFKNPGPAISIISKFLISFSKSIFNLAARLFGFNLFDLPKTNEILQDKSKLNFSGGTSRLTLFKLSRLIKLKFFLCLKTQSLISDK